MHLDGTCVIQDMRVVLPDSAIDKGCEARCRGCLDRGIAMAMLIILSRSSSESRYNTRSGSEISPSSGRWIQSAYMKDRKQR